MLPGQVSKNLWFDQGTGLCPHKAAKAHGHVPYFFKLLKRLGQMERSPPFSVSQWEPLSTAL